MRRFGFLFLIPILCSNPANAARMSLVGLANSAQPTQPGTEYTGQSSYGGGILLEARMIPMFGLEFGALYAPRKFSFSTATPVAAKFTMSANAYEFPVLLRFHLGRFFSFGVGGYYAKAKGDIALATEMNGATSSSSTTFAAQNQSDSDYGIATSIALTSRLGPLTHLVLDGRYLIGLKNDSLAASGNMKFNDMEVLAGLQFGF